MQKRPQAPKPIFLGLESEKSGNMVPNSEICEKSAGPSLRGTTAADIGNQLLMTSHSFQDFNCFLAVVNSFQDFKCLLAVVSSQVADCCLLSVIVS